MLKITSPPKNGTSPFKIVLLNVIYFNQNRIIKTDRQLERDRTLFQYGVKRQNLISFFQCEGKLLTPSNQRRNESLTFNPALRKGHQILPKCVSVPL